MKLGVPWRVKGIRPDARETAREAARRAGMSVGEWLNTIIIEQADDEGIRLSRRGGYADEDDNEELFSVHERLDELTRQLERLHRAPAPRPSYPPAGTGPEAYAPPSYTQNRESNQLADAIAQLNRRMDQLVSANQAATTPAYLQPAYASPHVPAPQGYVPPDHAPAAYAPQTYTPPIYAPEPPIAAPADAWMPDLDKVMAEIAARQQALEADPDAPQPPQPRPAAPPPRQQQAPSVTIHHPTPPQMPVHEPLVPQVPSQNLSGLEQHLRHITGQIEALRQQPQLGEGIAALRQALSDIARTLLDAMPRRAIEALEGEVKQLAARLDDSRHAGVDGNTLAAVERGLAEVRDTLRALTPAENLDGFRQAVHSLAQKVDLLGTVGPDVNAFQQLESAIAALQGIVSHVASNDALAHLAAEVHALGQKVDHVADAAAAGGDMGQSNALEILDQRVAHIADALESRVQNGGSVPPQLESVIQGLTDKIERLQHSRSDDASFGHLENRVAELTQKLDASGARFSQLEAIERGLADLVTYIEHQQAAAAQTTAPQMDGLQRDIMRTQTSLEAVHGTLGHMIDRLAMLESGIRETRQQPQLQPQPEPQPQFQAQPREFGHDRRQPPVFENEQQWQHELAVEPGLQMPLAAQLAVPAPEQRAEAMPAFASEPVSAETPSPPPSREVARAQAVAAMARANPKAARAPIDPNLPPDEPLEPGSSRGRLTASPADRIAASEAALGRAKPKADNDSKSNFIAAARRAAKAATAEPTTADLRAAASQAAPDEKAGKSLTQRMRQLFVGASVILLVGGSLRIASNLMDTGDAPAKTEITTSSVPAALESRSSPRAPQPETAAAPAAPALEYPPSHDVTGSLPAAPSYTLPPSLALPTVPSTSSAPTAEKLPVQIGGAGLRTAAAAGDAAAEYEIGLRYAEGRGVAVNAPEAARWLERSAKQGLTMAQFRLAGFYEKGFGVKKDLETARRLYRTAADQGNAKAMHNLAVLYAEGAAVKPDYRTAAQWFRLASDHGVSDSQYNLAILYARGIGVDQNLVESYKWFTLAAAQGDQDAGRKRDEVGKRLDPAALSTATLAAQTFVPKQQPEAATAVKLPPGGWDAATSGAAEPAPAKPKRNAPIRVGSS